MRINNNRKWAVFILAMCLMSIAGVVGMAQLTDGFSQWWGTSFSPAATLPPAPVSRRQLLVDSVTPGTSAIQRWNEIGLNASGLDHAPTDGNHVFGEQLGPVRSIRAIAILQIAVFEVINSATGTYRSYIGQPRTRSKLSLDAAIAQTAHDTLVALYPSQSDAFGDLLAQDLGAIADGTDKANGVTLGRLVAKTILQLRAKDGSQHAELLINVNYLPANDPGIWRQDPISLIPLALGAKWDQVKPFVMKSASQFRIPPPPPMDSPEYTEAYNEAKALGGDGVTTPTSRTAEQTQIGTFWAYDGTPSLCAPPRLYNQIVVHIANQMGTSGLELARLLALANIAMADTGIAAWESKYFYKFWRPVGGIREADPGTGPTGQGDGNDDTAGDSTFSPLGAPASNLMGPNFTPPFPAYPSGHAAFGGALFQTLRKFYGTDNIAFTFVSDEFNGMTMDNQGNTRPLMPRSFTNLSQPEEENGQSRIYLGIHWSFDKTEGIAQGRRVADLVFKSTFLPAK